MENLAPVLVQDIMWTTVILHQVNCLITKGKSSGNSTLYCIRICSGHVMSPCIRIGAGTCGKSCIIPIVFLVKEIKNFSYIVYIANVTHRTFEIVQKNRDPANIKIIASGASFLVCSIASE